MMFFTKQQQAIHCLQLAEFLKKLKPHAYNHKRYMNDETCGTVGCALGWAAQQGIGGLENGGLPGFPIGSGREYHFPLAAADVVFGEPSGKHIFSRWRPNPKVGEPRGARQLSIYRLQQQAKQLLQEIIQ